MPSRSSEVKEMPEVGLYEFQLSEIIDSVGICLIVCSFFFIIYCVGRIILSAKN